jgi:long-subunit fatty acid transport protein
MRWCTIRKTLAMAALVLLITAATGNADEYHYVNMLVGNRAAGLGGAYAAISDDPEGCYYNPAGIAMAPFSSLSASVNAYSQSEKTYEGALLDTGGSTLDWKQTSSSLLPNFFGVIHKTGPGMLGFSYAVSDSIYRRQKQTFHNIASRVDDNAIENYVININDSDKTYFFGPSYAYRVTDTLSVGATFYLYYRDKEIIRNQVLQFEQGQHYLMNYYETNQSWGYRPIAGVVWEPVDKLSLGLSLAKTVVTSSDSETQLTFRDTLAEDAYELDGQNFDFSDTNALYLASSDSSEKEKFPLTVATGITYFVSPSFLVSGDVTYYEAVSEKERVINFALGSEYYPWEWVAIRGGFFTDFSHTPELNSDHVNQDEHVDIFGGSLSGTFFTHQSSITLGFTYAMGQGEAQVVADTTSKQDVEIKNMTIFLSASYNF